MDGQQALTAADGTDTTSGLSAGEHNGEQLESQNNRQKQGDKARNIKAQGPLICVVSCDLRSRLCRTGYWMVCLGSSMPLLLADRTAGMECIFTYSNNASIEAHWPNAWALTSGWGTTPPPAPVVCPWPQARVVTCRTPTALAIDPHDDNVLAGHTAGIHQGWVLLLQVPGCTVDVSAGPHYLKRHKICQEHLKARSVVIDGQEVR